MNSRSTLDELRELLDITQRCVTQAQDAQRQVARYAEHYRFQVEEFKKLASRAHSPEMSYRFLRIAAANERLAQLAAGEDRLLHPSSDATAVREAPLDDERIPGTATESVEQEVTRKRRACPRNKTTRRLGGNLILSRPTRRRTVDVSGGRSARDFSDGGQRHSRPVGREAVPHKAHVVSAAS